MKQTLSQIVKTAFISSALAAALAFSASCRDDDEQNQDSYNPSINPTNSPAVTNSVPSTPAEPEQYVALNTKDIRGTWYYPGNSGGWYGPYNQWGFRWYYFEQYGEKIVGKTEFELYEGYSYEYLREVKGKITGDRLYLLEYDYDGNVISKINARANGRGEIEGTETIASGESQGSTSDFYIKNTSSEISRRDTPWD